MTDLTAIPKETKDWSAVAEKGCSECGYSPPPGMETARRLRQTALSWREVLTNSKASQRPNPLVWSPLEYAAHARDMCRLACERVELMLSEDAPTFSNWDQDEQAVINNYLAADLREISADLERELELAARTFERVPASGWGRSGLRGDGAVFTVESFAHFVLHEVEHHLQDAQQGCRQDI
jgi:hypothetical protein